MLTTIFENSQTRSEQTIVAVHGLNPGKSNHGENTWSKNGVLWLQDKRFLPGRFPKARVLLFGYNSKVTTGTSIAGVLDIAKALLNRLRSKRRDNPDRPIVFLCHSLGGIVVKQALVLSVHSTVYDAIRSSTKAIAFFGTPHRGGNGADLGSTIASIMRAFTGSAKNDFMDTLQKSSSGATNIHEMFKEQVSNYQIVSFYETLPYMTGSSFMIVDRVSATLGLPDTIEISVPMATNHSDICKFDQQDSAYELVIENITDLVQHALRSTRIDAPLLTPSISLTDPQNQRRTLSVASSLSLESTDVSSSTNSSMAGGGHYGMPTFQDSSGDDSSSALQLDNTPTTPVIILPYNTNSEFVGRDVVFNAIKDALRTSSTGQSRAALYGLGGVGKSQVAIRYAYWYRQTFPDHSIFWLHCGTAERIRQGLIEIGINCHVPGITNPDNDQLLLLKNWLHRKTDFKWLIILDNADDPTIFREAKANNVSTQGSTDLASYIPDCYHGSVLITTRDLVLGQRLANGRSPIKIGRMSREESVALLKSRLQTRDFGLPLSPATPASYQQPVIEADLLRLAKVLDYLPLAMAQAAGYITESAISVGHYLRMFEDDASAVQLLEHRMEDTGQDSDVPASIYATWKLSIEQIQERYPKSAELIFLMAYYEQLQIPASLLKHQVGNNEVEFATIIGVLLRFSLIVSGSNATFNMHRLVQLIVKKWLEVSGSAKESKSKALRLLSDYFPDGEFQNWVTCASLDSHAVKVIQIPKIEDADLPFLGSLQQRLAWYYFNIGRWSSAETHARAACIILQESHGIKNKETLSAKIQLGHILKQNGKLDEAELIVKQTVDNTKAVLGSKDALYFDALDLSALIAQTLGKLVHAEKFCRKAMEGRENVQGKFHPRYFESQRRLATILEFSGKYNDAETIITAALEGQKHLIGTADKITLKSMQRLVFIQRAQGKYDEAEATARQYLKIQTESYGPTHIASQEALYTYGASLIDSNKIQEAEPIFLNMVKFIETERPFGPDHQYNFFVQNALGRLRTKQGRHLEASKHHEVSWNGIQKTYHKGHVKTLEHQSKYAAALFKANPEQDFDKALKLQQQACQDLQRGVGEDHPSTLDALIRLSEMCAYKEDFGQALKLSKRALKGREKRLNAHHPDILLAKAWLHELEREKSKGNKGTTVVLEKLETAPQGKKQKQRWTMLGLRKRSAKDTVGGDSIDAVVGKKDDKKSDVIADANDSENIDVKNPSGKWRRWSGMGLLDKAMEGSKDDKDDKDDKDEGKEAKVRHDLDVDSDSDAEETARILQMGNAISDTAPPTRLPPQPPQPPQVSSTLHNPEGSQGNAAIAESKVPHSDGDASNQSLSDQQNAFSKSANQQIRRKPIISKSTNGMPINQGTDEKEVVPVLPTKAPDPARLDGPGWDDSPF